MLRQLARNPSLEQLKKQAKADAASTPLPHLFFLIVQIKGVRSLPNGLEHSSCTATAIQLFAIYWPELGDAPLGQLLQQIGRG
jgi:hypothetical protein